MQATARALGSTDARVALLRARCLQMLGDADGAAGEYRGLIREGREVAKAWFALLDIKTITLTAGEVRSIQRFASEPKRTFDEKLLLDFAMARIHEAAGEFDEALVCLERGNSSARSRRVWSASAHSQFVDKVADAFACRPAAHDQPDLGQEAIFVVSLPRSGSTLVEQILAAHPQVEGGSELSDLQAVIAAESNSRRKPFPDWVADADAHDWQRLGTDYLARTARWRHLRPIFTDKTPDNWKYVGAIGAMLPGAKVIDCRRDALETCWSCFKQLFAPGVAGFAYTFEDLASYWKDYLRLSTVWDTDRHCSYRIQSYEALAAHPTQQTAELLAFCGLPADERCLHPERAPRAIRTASSAQVREPIRNDTARAAAYGSRLARLVALLGSVRA